MLKKHSHFSHQLVDPSNKFVSGDLTRDQPGEAAVLTCNDAIARGAIEAGVRVVACYPGAPVSYVIDALSAAAQVFPEMHVEWSANEKCAYEVALGAAMSETRSMCLMKNVGVPWILDPLASSSMVGVGGLVIVAGDDPGAETTQAEEDFRNLARFAEVPVLEPATLQEVKDMVAYAFRLSEDIAMPVFVRVTVRQGYSRGKVTFGAIDHEKRRIAPRFEKNVTRGWSGYPALGWPETGTALLHKRFHGEAPGAYLALMRDAPTEEGVLKAADGCPFNRLSGPDRASLCVITSGLASIETTEALSLLDAEEEVAVLKLGFTLPVPPALVKRTLAQYEQFLIVEETEAVIEEQVRALASEVEGAGRILGKKTKDIPYSGEITSEVIEPVIARLLDRPSTLADSRKAHEATLDFVRESVPFKVGGQFCAGCPETAPTRILREVLDTLPGEGIACGDSGCGFVSQYAPVSLTNTFVCMGAGLGVATGISHAGLGKIAAVMGDSTFFHNGIVELINAVYNRANVLLLILDNKSSAETGHQPHPGAFGLTATRKPTKELSLEEVIKPLQVDFLRVVDAYDVAELRKAFEEGMAVEGVSVVITTGACALIVDRQRKEKRATSEDTV
ncbi:indolepyruvate ferredoxin oxidoreductase subunit alpha [Rhodomicrobium lacus]|uniref:thiamine pyrophosphate-dependent enzyme n=1 Tax=Rhodomicrobium lacus TaxID=2498452 RepID=UPI000F8C929F|nr:indolepyruvate ferredoxin oxidoreductase subunit alpha [Rhodomicrobium lacus]